MPALFLVLFCIITIKGQNNNGRGDATLSPTAPTKSPTTKSPTIKITSRSPCQFTDGECSNKTITPLPTFAPVQAQNIPNGRNSSIFIPSNTTNYPTKAPISVKNDTDNTNASLLPTLTPIDTQTHNNTNDGRNGATLTPTIATNYPTTNTPTIPTIDSNKHIDPTFDPTLEPTTETTNPTTYPSIIPTVYPTIIPSINPTLLPTIYPTVIPSMYPTFFPTVIPSMYPTVYPTLLPTIYPTVIPSTSPTFFPTTVKPTTSVEGRAKDDGTTSYLMVTQQMGQVENSGGSSIVTGAVIGGGACGICAVIIGIICIVKCKKSSKQNSGKKEEFEPHQRKETDTDTTISEGGAHMYGENGHVAGENGTGDDIIHMINQTDNGFNNAVILDENIGNVENDYDEDIIEIVNQTKGGTDEICIENDEEIIETVNETDNGFNSNSNKQVQNMNGVMTEMVQCDFEICETDGMETGQLNMNENDINNDLDVDHMEPIDDTHTIQ